jgi:hypothetical protein
MEVTREIVRRHILQLRETKPKIYRELVSYFDVPNAEAKRQKYHEWLDVAFDELILMTTEQKPALRSV